jgi:murein L,D-transpeptidase YcbB/YkuD
MRDTGIAGTAGMRSLIRWLPAIPVLLALLSCAPERVPVGQDVTGEVESRLRVKIESGRGISQFTCRQEILCGSSVIPVFYERRGFAPAWSGRDGRFPLADSLIAAIRESDREGLHSYDYHLAGIEPLLAASRRKRPVGEPYDPEIGADLDLLLTDAFLLYGSHLLAGRVNPETLHADWIAYNPSTDLAALLESALGGDNVAETLRSLRPHHPGYARLQTALAQYRELAGRGGWPAVPPGGTLRNGNGGDRVELLRKRLAATGDLDLPAAQEESPFDEALEAAVRRFQRRHGLEDDGIVGRQTLAALNVPVEKRVAQMEWNMERWRWVPRDLGDRYILVNIPEYRLRIVDPPGGEREMRIIVGKHYTATPVFSGVLNHLEINPYWNIPHSIAVGEVLPKIRQDPGYLAKQGIRVFRDWRDGAPEIDPETVDWSRVDDRSFSFKLRQEPGPLNPLGRLKFLFPNKFAVYLHDTPARGLFRNFARDASHGCIRVEKPLELAAALLRDDARYSKENLLERIDRGVRETIPLRHPVPVHILYWTAWVDDGGTIQFREDIYGRDIALSAALKETPPAPRES